MTSRRESTTNQRDQSASPIRRISSGRDENINRDNTNQSLVENNINRDNIVDPPQVITNTGGESGRNVGDTGGDLGGNLDNATYSSSSDLINSALALNITASQNDSDFSMPDVEGGSQPLEPINEAGG
jgi:hypothetical protein